MNKYRIDITLKDFTYYLMSLSRNGNTEYTSTDVKKCLKPTYTHIRNELGRHVIKAIIKTEECWTQQDLEFILSNYQQEDVFDDENNLLGIRYKYMARFIKALEDVFDDVDDE